MVPEAPTPRTGLVLPLEAEGCSDLIWRGTLYGEAASVFCLVPAILFVAVVRNKVAMLYSYEKLVANFKIIMSNHPFCFVLMIPR
jgi:hypothetical protein